MKILLFSHLGQFDEYAAYVNAFKKVKPVQTLMLTMGRDEYRIANDFDAFDVVKDILPDESVIDVADTDVAIAAQSLKELEDRLESTFVNRDILMDRYFRGQPAISFHQNTVPLIWTGSRAKQFMFVLYKRLEEEIRIFDPDFMYLERNSGPYRMAWRLAHERGVPAGEFMPARFWTDRVYLETGIGLDWLKARAAYQDMKDTPMTSAELATVKERLRSIREEKAKPAYLHTEHAKGASNFFKRLHPKLLFAGFDHWLGARSQTSTTNPRVLPREVHSPIAKYIRYRRGSKGRRYLQKHQTPFERIRSKKYAIYFLHVQPEFTVEETAFDYQDQANTLRNILACLPADMELVVKEHTPMLGHRPLEVYGELVHTPGIIIADAHDDSHKLIAEASLVVTLTGTVALEAVLYGIPAIVLGSIFFDCFNGIYKPQNLSDLKKMLSNPARLRGATEDDALRALGSMLRASVPGRPARERGRKLEQIDFGSAKAMVLELENARQK